MGKITLTMLIPLFILAFGVALLVGLPLTHRQKIRAQKFPEAWREILQKHFKLYSLMGAQSRTKFENTIKLFFHDTTSLSLGEVEMDLKRRLLSAAPWCALTLVKKFKLKRLMIYSLEESKTMTPQEAQDELLLIWDEPSLQVRRPPHLGSHQSFSKVYNGQVGGEEWLEFCYEGKGAEEPQSFLGQYLKKLST